jgi:FkbM family methyltransferase
LIWEKISGQVVSKFLSGALAYVPPRARDWILEKRHSSRTIGRLTRKLAVLLRNKEVEISSGPAKGLVINVGDSAAAYVLGNFKAELQAFMASNLKTGNVFLDVGANVGFFSLLAARLVGPTGKVFSFEPLAENVSRLKENIRRNQFLNIEVIPHALGVRNEERTFQVSERPTWGKLESTDSQLPDKYLFDTKVTVRRLDDLLADGVLQPPHFVKIDVEGAEIEVIEGARETLLKHRPVLMIEMHGTARPLLSTFTTIGYYALPLESRFDNVSQAYWNAMILAFPSERTQSIASARIHFDTQRL